MVVVVAMVHASVSTPDFRGQITKLGQSPEKSLSCYSSLKDPCFPGVTSSFWRAKMPSGDMGGPVLGCRGGRNDVSGTHSLQLGPTQEQMSVSSCETNGLCEFLDLLLSVKYT